MQFQTRKKRGISPMIDWEKRYAHNMKQYDGYAIGKTFSYLSDPDIISLAGGLPSPDVFQTSAFRAASEKILSDDIAAVMQYSAIPGEQALLDAVIGFLKRDDIHLDKHNLLITTSGQQGLDLAGRLFINPGDIVLVDRPTFAGALTAFRMENPRFMGVDIAPDGTDTQGLEKIIVRQLSCPVDDN